MVGAVSRSSITNVLSYSAAILDRQTDGSWSTTGWIYDDTATAYDGAELHRPCLAYSAQDNVLAFPSLKGTVEDASYDGLDAPYYYPSATPNSARWLARRALYDSEKGVQQRGQLTILGLGPYLAGTAAYSACAVLPASASVIAAPVTQATGGVNPSSILFPPNGLLGAHRLTPFNRYEYIVT